MNDCPWCATRPDSVEDPLQYHPCSSCREEIRQHEIETARVRIQLALMGITHREDIEQP